MRLPFRETYGETQSGQIRPKTDARFCTRSFSPIVPDNEIAQKVRSKGQFGEKLVPRQREMR